MPEAAKPLPPAPPVADARPDRKAFLASIQHELRTPVNTLIGFSRIGIEEGLLDPDRCGDLQRILDVSIDLRNLINSLLEREKDMRDSHDLSLNALAARVRHDLKNPVAAVISYAEMLEEDLRDSGESAYMADLSRILSAARQLNSSIDQVAAEHPAIVLARTRQLASKAVTSLRTLEVLGGCLSESGKVLIVDDNENNQELLRRTLTRVGYQVESALNGALALQRLGNGDIDAVLLDLIMPDMDGYEVLTRLKCEERLRRIPVIVISAYDDTESVARCIQLGADDYLVKPYNTLLLRARLASSLEKNRLRERERDLHRQIYAEKQRSDQLLRNILPKPIAERLKRGERPIIDECAQATVLFCDLVNFTNYAAMANPAQTVEYLTRVFEAFDVIAMTHGVEKIKTIGDSYMAVGGLPVARSDHAAAIADAALDMVDAVGRFRFQGRTLQVRIGIHSGPVAAGVIGHKVFSYDLWGDTVNLASRMESLGIPGHIQVSTATRNQLNDQFLLEERGTLVVKGRGTMTAWLLQGRAEHSRNGTIHDT